MLETQCQEKKWQFYTKRFIKESNGIAKLQNDFNWSTLCILTFKKKPHQEAILKQFAGWHWRWYIGWTSLFGLNLGGQLSTCPSFRPFGLWKPQKVPKEVSTYFSLNLNRLWCYLRFLQDILLRLWCYLCFCSTGKVCGHLFMYFLRFLKPKWTERHALRCPPRFSPKRVFHLISIIIRSKLLFDDVNFWLNCFQTPKTFYVAIAWIEHNRFK